MAKQMAQDVSNMMKYKVQAVKRIMNVAEEVSQDPSYLQDEWKGYYNAKIINKPPEFIEELEKRYPNRLTEYYGSKLKEIYSHLDLTPSSHFDGAAISLNASTVHVPTSVFDGAPHVRRAIRWSEALEKTFYSNYEHDPTLSWQFFGSATGFLRQFPGSAWEMDADDPDLYDARFRSWYIQAANSPKDMVILLDVSGSMTGIRKEISKHVVLNILETLNENDYVNIFSFSENTTELVPCFNDTLVQANLENIGEFKQGLEDIQTENIANFSKALTKAFKLLLKHKKSGHGSHCNQVIMLITDGAPYTYDHVFEEFNWPQLQTRLFTYLIGREVTEARSLTWMACANKGYFVHVTTASEVREQVLKYIPVVARPMVMYQSEHPIIWTGVYADIADPKQTKWLWELRERDRQMRRTNNYRELKRLVESKDYEKYQWVRNDKKEIEKFLLYGEFGLTDRQVAEKKAERAKSIRGGRESLGTKHGYRLMTTVSVPVLNKTVTAERVADLLGVAGADVPIREIEKLVPPYELGVNGYSFMVNRNGYILYHPDLRLTNEGDIAGVIRKTKKQEQWFQDILKPSYNSVDLAEVELIDVSDDPRQNHSELNTAMGRAYNTKLRRDMIEQRNSEALFRVRIHLDKMKRVEVRDQRYFTFKVSDTPFSLGIALPEGYGKYKVKGEIEISRALKDKLNFNATSFFSSGNWSLHPDWVYCEYKYDRLVERTPEELMIHFLVKAQLPGWKWRSTRTRPPPASTQQTKGQRYHYDEGDYYCDKTLVQSLLFDARATDVYNNNQKKKFEERTNQGKHKNFGITKAFVATRSGLSRWLDIDSDLPDLEGEPHFMKVHNRAIDEVWYRRAVDYYKEDPEAYVYSVPFDAANRDQSEVQITASRAIFMRENRYKVAPAAVVGVNIRLDKFVEFFKNKTYEDPAGCREYSLRKPKCKKDKTCQSESLDCYLLDDNGFIVASEKKGDIGKFFGAVEGTIMESLVQSDLYSRIKIYDYQAVCLDVITEGSFASILMTPVQMLKWASKWLVGNIMWVLVKTQLYQLWDPNAVFAYSNNGAESGNYPDHVNGDFGSPSTFTAATDQGIMDDMTKKLDQKIMNKPMRVHQHMADQASVTVESLVQNDSLAEDLNKTRYTEVESEAKAEQNIEETTKHNETEAFIDTEKNVEAAKHNGAEVSIDTEENIKEAAKHNGTEVSIDSEDNIEDAAKHNETEDSIDTEENIEEAAKHNRTEVSIDTEENIKEAAELNETEASMDNEDNIGDGEAAKHNETEASIDTKEGIIVEEVDLDYDLGHDFDGEHHPPIEEEDEFPKLKLAYINKTRPRPCDKEVNLYKLNNSKLKEAKSQEFKPVKGKLSNCHANGCGKPFSIQKVVRTNLVLIVVHNLCPCESRTVGIEPVEVVYSEAMHCDRLLQKHFRKRPDKCYNYHPDETSIKDCGGSGRLESPTLFSVVFLVILHVVYMKQAEA